jgi:hypothetical protein
LFHKPHDKKSPDYVINPTRDILAQFELIATGLNPSQTVSVRFPHEPGRKPNIKYLAADLFQRGCACSFYNPGTNPADTYSLLRMTLCRTQPKKLLKES